MKLFFSHVGFNIILLTLAIATALVPGYDLQEAHHTRHSVIPDASRCPPSCHCAVEPRYLRTLSVDCRDRNLSNLELPSGTTSVNFFNVKTTLLQGLEFSPDTIEITYRSSGIHRIGLKVFQDLKNLEVLDLADNRIETIQPVIFSNLINLKRLNLSGNTLHHFLPELFHNLTLLKELHLSNNHLHVSQPKMFTSLVALQSLDLSYNQITSIVDSFPNKNLVNLSLSHNSIRDIHAHAFINLSNLMTLDLSYNVLEVLPDNLFQKTYELQYLDLTGNSIKNLPSIIFSSLKKIKYLGLNGNNIDHIPDSLFASNMELEILKLAGNNIEVFSKQQTVGLTSLKELDLKDNMRLIEIALSSKQLESIDLSGNNLTRPPFFLTDPLMENHLHSVRLKDNPWICDCQMKWFVDWSAEHREILDESQTCYLLPKLECLKPVTSRNKTIQLIEMRSNATIDCNLDGNPYPSITWVTPTGVVFHYFAPDNPIFTDHPRIHNQDMSIPEIDNRIRMTDKGALYINYVMRTDAGLYTCFASNPLANLTTYITVHLDRDTFYNFKLTSVIIGISCAAGFLLCTVIGHLIVFIFKKCGWTCCCISEELPRVKQFYQMMEGLEEYKTQQLERLRENYTQQVHKIKDNCAEQVDWIRDSYQGQVKHLRDIRDYGTHHLTSIRGQYLDQMKKVRDYSTGQLSWVRENYVFQRNRIRKFSTHQVLRFRETYKYQQQTLNKILENLPNLYLDNCRSGSCGNSESSAEGGLDETDIAGIDVYIKRKIDSLTKPSQLDDAADDQSEYYTPSELSESPRSPSGFSQFPCIPSEDEDDESSTASLKPPYGGAQGSSRYNDGIPPALSRRIFQHRSAFVPINVSINPADLPSSSSHDVIGARETTSLMMPPPLQTGSTPWLQQPLTWTDDSPCDVFKCATDNTTKDASMKPSTSLPTLPVKNGSNKETGPFNESNKTITFETAL